MEKYNLIKCTLKNGRTIIWDAVKGEWDDYSYDGKVFVVKKCGVWVGIYNMDSLISVTVS